MRKIYECEEALLPGRHGDWVTEMGIIDRPVT